MKNISFVIPAYNNIELLVKCLFSIKSQIDSGDEIIIIDDGSTDGTYNYISNKYKSYENIKIYSQKNAGSGAARNNGVKHSKNEYIWFVDSDDYIASDSVRIIKNYLEKNDDELVFFDYYLNEISDQAIMNINIDLQDKNSMLLTQHFPWNKVIKSKLLEHVKFPEGRIRYQDHGTIPIVISLASNVGYIKEPLYIYNEANPDSISKKKNKNSDIFIAFRNLIDASNEGKITQDQLEILFIYTFIFAQIYNTHTNKFADIQSTVKKIKSYLDLEFPNWRKSKYFSISLMKKYSDVVDKLQMKIIVGKIARYSTFGVSIMIFLYRKLRK